VEAPLAAGYRERPWWWDEADLPLVAAARLPDRADIVVVGSGYTGLGAALEAARAGRHVVVLDREAMGWGASSRNGGMAHPGVKHDPPALLREPDGRAVFDVTMTAFESLEAFTAELDAGGADCGFRRTGHLELAHHPRLVDDLRESARVWRDDLGVDAQFVESDALGAEIGSRVYHAGLVVPVSGGLHPARFHGALAAAALAAGVEVHEHTPALALEDGGVRTPRGVVRAGEIVVATNGYTDELVPWLKQRILPIGSYIIATEPFAPAVAASVMPTGRMCFDTRNFLHYWRLSPDSRRLLFGGRTSFAPTTVARSRDKLYEAMVAIHPQLAGVRVERAWGGNVALTADRMPHSGRVGPGGPVYAMGYCGTGVALSTYAGREIGRWLAAGGAGDGPASLAPIAARSWPSVPAPARRSWLLPPAGWWYQARDRLGV
jgi:glycine/D-amino acid oxidase-like deaminating enzyme